MKCAPDYDEVLASDLHFNIDLLREWHVLIMAQRQQPFIIIFVITIILHETPENARMEFGEDST